MDNTIQCVVDYYNYYKLDDVAYPDTYHNAKLESEKKIANTQAQHALNT